jgi:peptide/nickel transport system substrate-binding protein
MDVKDVLFSMNHHRGEETKSGAKTLMKAVKDVKTDGKYTVIFELESGNADFPYILSDYHMQIVPDGTTDFEKGIGTGGYILQSFELA